MVYKINNLIIQSHTSISYINEVIEYLDSQIPRIMNFFDLKQLKKERKIVVWDDIKKYKEHCEEYTNYKVWMCGDTFDGNINMLSIEECRKTEEHSDMTIEEFKTTLAHEFVHICHQDSIVELVEDNHDWFWEALATNLANPFDKLCRINGMKENLINCFNDVPNNYQIAFSIGRYMIENYPHDLILKYIRYPQFLVHNAEIIINEADLWIQNMIEDNFNKTK